MQHLSTNVSNAACAARISRIFSFTLYKILLVQKTRASICRKSTRQLRIYQNEKLNECDDSPTAKQTSWCPQSGSVSSFHLGHSHPQSDVNTPRPRSHPHRKYWLNTRSIVRHPTETYPKRAGNSNTLQRQALVPTRSRDFFLTFSSNKVG